MPTGERFHGQRLYQSRSIHSTSFAVATVMFSTTTIIAIQMVYVKHLPMIIAIAFFLIFGFFDGEANYTLWFFPFSLAPRPILGSIVEEGPTCASLFFT